jgi:DNA-binding Xre family transcriptional regulator
LITYDKLWKTMREKGVTQYDLYTKYNMNRSQLNRLKHNKNVTVITLDRLCNILSCDVGDIIEHFPDDNKTFGYVPE